MTLKERARKLKQDVPAVFLALKDTETPLPAKVLAGITVAYALSPVDLIPDFIPVLGYLDDVILLAVQLLEKQKEVSPDSLRKMAEVLEGHFTFTVLDQDNNLYFIKGNNPLTIYHYPRMGLYLYASTTEILEAAAKSLSIQKWKKEIIEPRQGSILCIDWYGKRITSRFDDTNIASPWWGYPVYHPVRQEDEYLSFVMEMGECMGIPRQELQLFFCRNLQCRPYLSR